MSGECININKNCHRCQEQLDVLRELVRDIAIDKVIEIKLRPEFTKNAKKELVARPVFHVVGVGTTRG